MSNASYYRAEAQRMLGWAKATPHAKMAPRWRHLAEEYIILAEQFEATDTGRPAFVAARVERQPAQRQQAKSQRAR